MAIKRNVKSGLDFIDGFATDIIGSVKDFKKSVISLYFHGILPHKKDYITADLNPFSHRYFTVGALKIIIEYYMNAGFKFLKSEELVKDYEEDNYIVLTFDDGYYNNYNAIPVLEEYEVPATFYISAYHIKNGVNFWSDVLFSQRKKNSSIKRIIKEIEYLKNKNSSYIELYIKKNFGQKVLTEGADISRPMTQSELKTMALNKYVEIGNHTYNHDILNNYNIEEMDTIIKKSQKFLNEIVGKCPKTIAYPNGIYSMEAIKILKNNDIHLGMTIKHKKNYYPKIKTPDGLMEVGRFSVINNNNLIKQLKLTQADYKISYLLKSIYKKTN
jgi:peptidoglycan/xylan/chitin deacetylase (PgdA/CDA1 family)